MIWRSIHFYYYVTNETISKDQIEKEISKVKRNVRVRPIRGNKNGDLNILKIGASIYKQKGVSEEEVLLAESNDEYKVIRVIYERS